jgi:hypothetical protein
LPDCRVFNDFRRMRHDEWRASNHMAITRADFGPPMRT